MALYNTAGGQYQAVTGKKRRFPYAAFIESQIPSLYQSRQRKENQEFAESQLSLEEQAIEESSRASNAALSESIRSSDIQAGLRREEIEAQEKQAQTGALISGAQTAGLGYYGASKLGLFGGGKAAGAAGAQTAASGAGKALIDTSGAVTGYTGAGPGVTAGGGGLSAATIGGGIAAGAALDDYLSRNVAGTLDDPQASFEQKTRGITRYGGSSPLTTALIEKGLGKKGTEIVDKITDPTEFIFGTGKGVLSNIERKTGGVLGASIPKFLGGGGSTGSDTIDKILNPLGTWLCTKTKETIGMTDEEWSLIGEFRKYAVENHKNWLGVYVNIGPALLEKINGDEQFYKNLKETFILPVIALTKGCFMEAAYKTYKSVVMQLIDKYHPGLTNQYPKGGE